MGLRPGFRRVFHKIWRSYDRFLEFSFRSSQFCSLLVDLTLPLWDTSTKQTISDLYILSFSISLNTNIILLEDSFSLLSLFICFESMTQSLEWKSLPGFTDSSNCVIHASASSSKLNSFHPPSTSTWATSKGRSMMFPLNVSKLRDEYLEINFGDLNGREACLTLNDAVV